MVSCSPTGRRGDPSIGAVTTLCCLLCLAASGPAQCAWVLCGQIQDPWGALAEVRLGGWPSREACEQERSDREQAPPALRMASYSCLPAAVDPRAPTGK